MTVKVMKFFKIIIVTLVAIMFSIIAINNILDYDSNFQFVKSVVSMDTVLTTQLNWRAVTNPSMQHGIYCIIIASEGLIAIVCWMGAFMMICNRKLYPKGVKTATVGLSLGFALFMFAFVIVAGEWFYMWNSTFRGVHTKAILLALTMASFTYFVSKK